MAGSMQIQYIRTIVFYSLHGKKQQLPITITFLVVIIIANTQIQHTRIIEFYLGKNNNH